mmetsp:Transcript_125656/g.349989  ORF Transcript_125656/g.349989 Transcript_125656/m.349989 type:complete len:719 (-) Transcript_125656:68-2224(-)
MAIGDLMIMVRISLGLLPGLSYALYDALNHIESARIYGNIDAYAYYYVDLLVGTPPQRVSVILDTGSGVVAFPCASCSHCGKHIDPAFDFGKSSSASWVPCGSRCAGRCENGKCTYYQGYTEGSSISGWWFQDQVRLGDALQHNPPVIGRMGCHQNENNLFYTQKANGIMGVGPHSRGGGRTLIQELFQDSAHVETNVFAVCLAEWGGRLVVGGFNATYHTGAVQYIKMYLTGYYGVRLTGMRVNGKVIATRFGSAMIDSGTTYTYMGSTPYRALRDAIVRYCQNHNGCGVNRGKCWTLQHGYSDLDQFPNVDVVFGDVTTVWVPKAYLYRKGSTGTWCYAFEDDGANANTVLGASWMLHQEIIFDMKTNRVGIARANCPEFRQRPEHRVDAARASPPDTRAAAPEPTTKPPTTVAPAPTTSRRPTTTTVAPTPATTRRPTTTTAAPTTSKASYTRAPRASPTVGDTIPPRWIPPPTTAPRIVAVSTSISARPSSTHTSRVVRTTAVGRTTAKAGMAPHEQTTTGPVPASEAANGTGTFVALQEAVAESGAVLGAGLTLGMCVSMFGIYRCCCRGKEHRHVQLKDVDDSGMPPQIVGSITEHNSIAGPDMFEIGDEDEDCEFIPDTEARPGPSPSPRLQKVGISGLVENSEILDFAAADPDFSLLGEAADTFGGAHEGGSSSGLREQDATWLGEDTEVDLPVFSGPSRAAASSNVGSA